jgi:hypothetical protein
MVPWINKVVPNPDPEASPNPYTAVAVEVGRTARNGGVSGENKVCNATILSISCGTAVTVAGALVGHSSGQKGNSATSQSFQPSLSWLGRHESKVRWIPLRYGTSDR